MAKRPMMNSLLLEGVVTTVEPEGFTLKSDGTSLLVVLSEGLESPPPMSLVRLTGRIGHGRMLCDHIDVLRQGLEEGE